MPSHLLPILVSSCGILIILVYLWLRQRVAKLISPRPFWISWLVRFPFRLFTFLLGALIFYIGFLLLEFEQFGLRFLSGFALFTGAQITLWSIGIALELFSNTAWDELDELL